VNPWINYWLPGMIVGLVLGWFVCMAAALWWREARRKQNAKQTGSTLLTDHRADLWKDDAKLLAAALDRVTHGGILTDREQNTVNLYRSWAKTGWPRGDHP
jgi:hypothetical protein